MIDELEDSDLKRQALAVSHAENVSDWVKALVGMQLRSPQRLVDLQQQLKMPLIEVWIAALLDGFWMEQRGSFIRLRRFGWAIAKEAVNELPIGEVEAAGLA